jgi:hypothetical protein
VLHPHRATGATGKLGPRILRGGGHDSVHQLGGTLQLRQVEGDLMGQSGFSEQRLLGRIVCLGEPAVKSTLVFRDARGRAILIRAKRSQ